MLDPSTERGKFGMDATQGISSASKTNPYQRSLTPVRDTSGFQQDQFIGQNPQGYPTAAPANCEWYCRASAHIADSGQYPHPQRRRKSIVLVDRYRSANYDAR